MSFFNGRAIVCKGDWSIDGDGRYWCENEQWGIIDKTGKEITPCRFDEIFNIENTDRFILCHEGGWQNGHNCIFDIEAGNVILTMDFDFDNGYMFNKCFYANGCIFFDEHQPGEEVDSIYAYSVEEKKWIAYREKYVQREFNGHTTMVVNKDGEDIIIYESLFSFFTRMPFFQMNTLATEIVRSSESKNAPVEIAPPGRSFFLYSFERRRKSRCRNSLFSIGGEKEKSRNQIPLYQSLRFFYGASGDTAFFVMDA